MVQPALPLVPGFRPQKAKLVATEPEPEVAGLEPTPQSSSNSGVTDGDSQSVVESSSPDALHDELSEGKEASPLAG